VVLVLVLGLSAPVGVALYSAVGADLFAPRNLIGAWPGLALSAGALLSVGTFRIRVVATALVITAFAIGAANAISLDEVRRPDYKAAAEFVDRHAGPNDPVVDVNPLYAPAPPTSIQASLSEPHPFARLGPTAFGLWTSLPVDQLQDRALAAAEGGRLVLVADGPRTSEPVTDPRPAPGVADWIPDSFTLVESATFDSGLVGVSAFVYEDSG
jgi:hypothetical protein